MKELWNMVRLAKYIRMAAVTVLVAGSATASAEGVQRKPSMVFIENEQIRLGVDLSIGGAVTHLSKKNGPNMINSYDWGRQIQMSFYSGPQPFEPNGKKVKPHWKHLGWNPIQAGDDYGNASEVLEHRKTADSIYIKCVPKHWPLNNQPAECTFESRFTLVGNVVKVEATLNNNRSDKTQYRARSQELPAVYSNGPWYRLMTYTGDKPFKGGELTEISRTPRHSRFPWNHFKSSENWAALVDKDNSGFGVWAPGLHQFLGGFAGTPGSGGPTDTHTGYVTPLSHEILDHNIKYQYSYTLIVGSVEQIRNYVYKNRTSAVTDFTFSKDRRSWFFKNAADAGWPVKGSWKIFLEKNNPQITSPPGCWSAGDYSALEITAGFKTEDPEATVRFMGYDKGSKDIAFDVTGDAKMRTYRIPLSSLPKPYTIGRIYLNPGVNGRKGQYVDIQSIRFVK